MQRKAILDRLLAERISQQPEDYQSGSANSSSHALPPEKRHELVQELLDQRRRGGAKPPGTTALHVPESFSIMPQQPLSTRPGHRRAARGDLLSPSSSAAGSEHATHMRQHQAWASNRNPPTGDRLSSSGAQRSHNQRGPTGYVPTSVGATQLQRVMEGLDLADNHDSNRDEVSPAAKSVWRPASMQVQEQTVGGSTAGAFEIDAALFESFSSHAETNTHSLSLHHSVRSSIHLADPCTWSGHSNAPGLQQHNDRAHRHHADENGWERQDEGPHALEGVDSERWGQHFEQFAVSQTSDPVSLGTMQRPMQRQVSNDEPASLAGVAVRDTWHHADADAGRDTEWWQQRPHTSEGISRDEGVHPEVPRRGAFLFEDHAAEDRLHDGDAVGSVFSQRARSSSPPISSFPGLQVPRPHSSTAFSRGDALPCIQRPFAPCRVTHVP